MTDELCECGHYATEHNYSPSGCAPTYCQHDATDWGAPRCDKNCREFYPADEEGLTA